jgi:hypothetical protein
MIAAIVIYGASRRHQERMELIKKGVNPLLFTESSGNKSLWLGILAFGIGAALLIAKFVTSSNDHDMLTGGLILTFAGIALIAFWKLTAGDRVRARRIQDELIAQELARMKQAGTLNSSPFEEPTDAKA